MASRFALGGARTLLQVLVGRIDRIQLVLQRRDVLCEERGPLVTDNKWNEKAAGGEKEHKRCADEEARAGADGRLRRRAGFEPLSASSVR